VNVFGCGSLSTVNTATVLLLLWLTAAPTGYGDEATASRIKALIANIGATATNQLGKADQKVWAVSRPAMDELVTMGAQAEPYLIETLKSPKSTVRPDVAMALGRIGSKAAVPQLLEALKIEEPDLRAECLSALGRIGDETVLDALRPFLRDGDIKLRYCAAEAICRLGDLYSSMPVLIAILREESSRVQLTPDGSIIIRGSVVVRAGKRTEVSRVEVFSDRARHILMKLSGTDFGFDFGKWTEWWEDNLGSPKPKLAPECDGRA